MTYATCCNPDALAVVGPVLGAEFLDDGRHLFRVGDRNNVEFGLCAPRVDPNRRGFEHVFVPLRIRPLHRQLPVFQGMLATKRRRMASRFSRGAARRFCVTGLTIMSVTAP